MISVRSLIVTIVLFMSGISIAQVDQEGPINFELEGLTFSAVYDTFNFCSNLTVTAADKSVIHFEECTEKIISISAEDLDSDGKKEVLIERYSGGAHCCTSLLAGRVNGNSFSYLDSVYFGNCFYYLEDLNKDGKKEIITCNDMFAYYFTNYAQSVHPVIVLAFRNGHFKRVNEEFKQRAAKEIKENKAELKEYTKSGFECPKKEGEDTFNTDAGAVKAILAAIAAAYHYIGETEKGYDYIDKVYNCPDKKKFIKILQNEFKIK